jgi:glycerophosphoryl diester phosphodiesterase
VSRRRDPVLISAHRAGVGRRTEIQNTRVAFDAALALDVDYVEFDVQRCADGTLVVRHDPTFEHDGAELRLAHLTGAEARALLPDLMTFEEVLDLLAGRKRAHIDLKATAARRPEHGVAATATAVARLGPDGFVITSGYDRTVRAIRDWSDAGGLDVKVGLSLGGNVRGRSPLEQLSIRLSELRPHHRLRRSRASVVVAHHALAWLGVAGFARRRGLPLLVWTVDTPRALAHWLRPGGAWLVTSNHPELAIAVRARRERRRPRPGRRTSGPPAA